MTRKFNLVDTSFSHEASTVAGRTPRGWVWDRACTDADLPTFYVHEKIFDSRGGDCHALLFESKAIIPQIYAAAPKVMDRFKCVFTHDGALLARFPEKCHFIPGGGIWVGGSYGLGEIKIYEKSKLVSMVSSTKTMCRLHEFRLQIANVLRGIDGIDVHVGGGGRGSPGWVPIIQSLADYMYSIVIENYVDDCYFTEKILNCFATGTIPIYLGARRIDKFFNPEGIVRFSNWDELKGALGSLSSDDYYSRLDAVQDNYERCHSYTTIEDYMEAHYNDKI